MRIKNLCIKEFKGLKNVDINFEKDDENLKESEKILNTIVLAGTNGSGKTRVLESIFEYFKDSVQYKENLNKVDVFLEIKEEIYKNDIIKNGIENEKYIYDVLNSYNYYKKNEPLNRAYNIVENTLDILPKIIYIPTEINFQKMEKAETNFEKEYQFLNIINSDLIKDIPSYISTRIFKTANKEENMTMGEVRKKVFKEINEIFEILELNIRLSGISKDEKSMPLFTNSSGDEFDINELSSGEKQLFLRTLAIKMLEPENSVIMIDEPELSLHPKWQQRIIDVYRKIGKNNQIIVATHSPHILGSVEKENIIILNKNDEGKIEVLKGKNLYDSYGQTTDRILEDIMGLKTTRNPEVFKNLEEIRNMVDKNKYDEPEFKEKYNYLRKILGSTDEDLILIDMDIQIRRKKGVKNAENK